MAAVPLATPTYSVASREGVGRVLLATSHLPLGATVLQDSALLSAPDGRKHCHYTKASAH